MFVPLALTGQFEGAVDCTAGSEITIYKRNLQLDLLRCDNDDEQQSFFLLLLLHGETSGELGIG